MRSFTDKQKAEAARREVGKRRAAYPKWVAGGTMTQGEADYQIAIMTEIAEDYEQGFKPRLPL